MSSGLNRGGVWVLAMAFACAPAFAAVLRAAPSPAEGNGSGTAQRGQVGRPGQSYLGIDVRDVAEEEVSVLRLKDAHGAEIIKVDHDGPAGKMGLRERDVVIGLNGVAIEGEDQIRRMLREYQPGKTVVLVICRDGQQLTVTAQMADLHQVERQVWEQHLSVPLAMSGPQAPANALPTGDDGGGAATASNRTAPAPASRYSKSFLGTLLTSPSYTGAMLEAMGPQLAQFFGVPAGSGLLVRSIEDNSPAAMAGMRAGDVVVRANNQRVGSMGDWARTIRDAKGRPVAVVVLRDKQERTLTVTPDAKKRSELELPVEATPVMDLAHQTAF